MANYRIATPSNIGLWLRKTASKDGDGIIAMYEGNTFNGSGSQENGFEYGTWTAPVAGARTYTGWASLTYLVPTTATQQPQPRAQPGASLDDLRAAAQAAHDAWAAAIAAYEASPPTDAAEIATVKASLDALEAAYQRAKDLYDRANAGGQIVQPKPKPSPKPSPTPSPTPAIDQPSEPARNYTAPLLGLAALLGLYFVVK